MWTQHLFQIAKYGNQLVLRIEHQCSGRRLIVHSLPELPAYVNAAIPL